MKKEMDALRKKIHDLQEDVFSKRYWLINHWLFLFFSTVHSPLFFRKIYIAKIQRFAFWAAIGDTRYTWNQVGRPYRQLSILTVLHEKIGDCEQSESTVLDSSHVRTSCK